MFQKTQPEQNFDSEITQGNHGNNEPDNVETVVGPSVVVEGDFASDGDILVKGTVSGSVKTGRLLTVEPGAKILANVRAGEATIAGEVRGNVKVLDRLELTASAQVLGDISCNVLVVAAGAILSGKISMGDEAEKTKKKLVKNKKNEALEVSE